MLDSLKAEHEEFRNRVNKLLPKLNSNSDFLQIIPDEELPDTRPPIGGVRAFLVPERNLSLKLFFDNFKNYTVCAAFAGLGAWVWGNPNLGLATGVSELVVKASAGLVWLVVAVFLALNCCQTWILSMELARSIWVGRADRIYCYRTPLKFWQVIWVLGHYIWMVLEGILFTLFAIAVPLTLIGISVGFAVYAVVVK